MLSRLPASLTHTFIPYPQVFFTVPQLFFQILQKKSWKPEFKASPEPQLLPLQPQQVQLSARANCCLMPPHCLVLQPGALCQPQTAPQASLLGASGTPVLLSRVKEEQGDTEQGLYLYVMLACSPMEISARLLPQSWCWKQRKEPSSEPFAFCGKRGFPIAEKYPPCIDSGEFHPEMSRSQGREGGWCIPSTEAPQHLVLSGSSSAPSCCEGRAARQGAQMAARGCLPGPHASRRCLTGKPGELRGCEQWAER